MEYRLLRTPFYRMIFIRLSVFYSYFYIDINTTLLSFQIFIESSVRYLHVGLQNEESDTESKEAKDSPTDEAQIKQENFILLPSIIAILLSMAALLHNSDSSFKI